MITQALPAPARSTKEELKRRAIVLAARKRFRRFGITKTTMNEIAHDLGLAVGTLYLYFKNKDELVVGTAEYFGYKHKRFAEKLLKSTMRADEKLRRYVLNRFRALEETRTSSTHAAEIARAVIRLKPQRIEEDDSWMTQNIAVLLEEGNREGVFKVDAPKHDAEVFLIAIRSFLPVAGMEPYRAPTERDLLKVVDWFINKWRGRS